MDSTADFILLLPEEPFLKCLYFSFQYPPSTAPAQHLFVHIGGTVTYADPLLEVIKLYLYTQFYIQ